MTNTFDEWGAPGRRDAIRQPLGMTRAHRGSGFPGRAHGGPGGFGPGFGGPRGFGPGPGGGFGFGRGGRRARRGDVRLVILSLLGEAPANGYALIKSIGERTGGAWTPSPGSVYPTLQQLVDEGLVRTSGDEAKGLYELTDTGRNEVDDKADEIARAWEVAPGIPESHRAFAESLHKLGGVLHMYRTSGTDEQVDAAAKKLDDLRRDLLKLLAE